MNTSFGIVLIVIFALIGFLGVVLAAAANEGNEKRLVLVLKIVIPLIILLVTMAIMLIAASQIPSGIPVR